MFEIYTTLLGERVEIGELSPEQKELLRKAFENFKKKENYCEFVNLVNSQDAVRIFGGALHNGQYWINEEVINSALSKVLEDLANRLAIEQGFARESDTAKQFRDFTRNEMVLQLVLR